MFDLEANGTTVRTELIAGLTTYLTMVYIAFVNPTILAAAGMDKGAVFVATCLAAAFGSALMGLWANYPVALAPGMGLNAYFAYSVVKGLGVPWQTALGAVFLSGVLFFLVSVTPVREWVINSISKSMKLAISVGIGFFLAFIGLQAAGIIASDPTTLVRLGDLKTPQVGIAVAAFLLMAALGALKVRGAILIGMLAAYAASLALGLSAFGGVASLPPSVAPVLLQMDVASALNLGLVAIVFTFFFLLEIGVRIAGHSIWKLFWKKKSNQFDLFLALTTTIILLPVIQEWEWYRYLTVFQVMRAYRLIPAIPGVRDLMVSCRRCSRMRSDESVIVLIKLVFLYWN